MNKRTKILAIGSAIILCSSIGYRIYNSQSASSNNSVVMAPQNINVGNKPRPNERASITPPPKGHIAQSIDNLARQIILDSPNQEEAYTFLVEAKSYRIQELRSRRAKGRAEESKASYDSEFWQKKITQIDDELAKDIEKDSIDTQAGSGNALQNMNYRSNNPMEQRPLPSADTNKKINLDRFVLRAIIKEGTSYVARLSYGERRFPAKKGYKLLGKVEVESVTSDEVALSMGENQVTLYTN